MTIIGSDPFLVQAALSGLIPPVKAENGGAGAIDLSTNQLMAKVGDPAPIVFARRINGKGGVMHQPLCTELRFEYPVLAPIGSLFSGWSSAVEQRRLLVVCQGEIDAIQIRDFFWSFNLREGTFSQAYNARAGDGWTPGQVATVAQAINLYFGNINSNQIYSGFCGSGGSYEGLTTLSTKIYHDRGTAWWNKQVWVFIRGGLHVTRLLDNQSGPSNNFADLVKWLLDSSNRVPADLIDTTSLLAAAQFTDALGLHFDGVLKESTNLQEWLSQHAPYFLLSQIRLKGKYGLKPLLPINASNQLSTVAITPVYAFTEEHILGDSFQITWFDLSMRKPFVAQMLWRQQDDDGCQIVRTTEVRFPGTAANGPYEQHDLSAFATSETHAVKVGAYILARRCYVSHSLSITVRPGTFNEDLTPGDIVQVYLTRVATAYANSVHNYLYEVNRISQSVTGEVSLELTHFPVNATGASLVALEVNNAVGNGSILGCAFAGVANGGGSNSAGNTGLGGTDFTTGNLNVDLPITIGGTAGVLKEFPPALPKIAAEPWEDTGKPTIGPKDQYGNYIGQTYSVANATPQDAIQWTADGVPIAGAIYQDYTTTPNDIGKQIGATVNDQPSNTIEAGKDPLKPPAPGTDPNVRIYLVLGNVYCAGGGFDANNKATGTCTQGRTVMGYFTDKYSEWASKKHIVFEQAYDMESCTTSSPGCAPKPGTDCSGNLPDLFFPRCAESRWFVNYYVRNSQGQYVADPNTFGTPVSRYVGWHTGPGLAKLVATYAP